MAAMTTRPAIPKYTVEDEDAPSLEDESFS